MQKENETEAKARIEKQARDEYIPSTRDLMQVALRFGIMGFILGILPAITVGYYLTASNNVLTIVFLSICIGCGILGGIGVPLYDYIRGVKEANVWASIRFKEWLRENRN